MLKFLNKFFKLEENKTTVKTELIAGLTTFFAMCYIIVVNPNQMTGFKLLPEIWNACFVGGIIAAVIATLCMAFIANKPFALAAGMGLNSFFYVSFILPNLLNADDGYKAGLAIILLSGIVFLILSLTGIRKYLAYNLPQCLKTAIPAGIGLFITFIGFQNCGLVVPNQYTGVSIVDFTVGASAAVPAIIGLFGFILVIVLSNSKNSFIKSTSMISSILICTALYYLCVLVFEMDVNITTTSLKESFSNWAELGLFGAFEGLGLVFNGGILGSIFSVVMLVITYCLVDMFDTLGTLYGASAEAGMLDENNDPIDLEKEMLCDSIGTAAGSLLGTSTITTFVESSAGVAAGGRTGLSSLVTAFLFLLCLFIAPLAQYVPSCATAPALIYVGLLMSKNILNIDFKDIRSASTGFITFIMMVVTYSISNGIMLGAITYVIISLLTKRFTKKDIVILIIALLGILRFAFIAM